MKHRILLYLLLLPILGWAQGDLPHPYSPAELELLKFDQFANPPISAFVETDPPPFVPRSMAEWEEIQSLVVTWTNQKTILADIIRYAKEECEVIVICSSVSQTMNELLNTYNLDNLDNVVLLQAPYNSIWIRDYGPHTIYENDVDSLYLVDWKYNRISRPRDDTIPIAIADYKNLTLYSTIEAPNDLVSTGGNFQSDGLGTAFSSKLVLEENEPGNIYGVSVKTEAQIDQILYEYQGIDRYIKFETLPYDVIHHIDMHFRMLDEERIIFGEYPEGVADGPQIEANIQYLTSNFNSSFGTPYEIVRIPMPPDDWAYPGQTNWADYRTYTNSVFVNKTVLVPTYDEQYDTTALRIYREQLPGYKVYGIDCNSIIESLGALHCIVKAVGVNDPLWIVHQAHGDVQEAVDSYEITATIKHRSGIEAAAVFYTADTTQGYSSVNMTLVDPDTDTWAADIPGLDADGEVFYYIHATANNGKEQVRPMPAPAGYWNFDVTVPVVGTSEAVALSSALEDIFPNPASAITCVPVSSSRPTDALLEVTDLLGRRIEVLFEGELPSGESKYFLDASRYVPGAYLVSLRAGDRVQVRKLLVQ